MLDKKHIFLTSIILGSIAMVSGLAIGLTNLLTKDIIARNEKEKIQEGLRFIYGENTTYGEEVTIEDESESAKYLNCYYTAKQNDNLIGYVFKTSGSNMYGKISMLVGISTSYQIGAITLITNEQTYASTLQEEYVDKYNNGNIPFENVDVYCGATYGAKLVNAMAIQAKDWAKVNLKGGN